MTDTPQYLVPTGLVSPTRFGDPRVSGGPILKSVPPLDKQFWLIGGKQMLVSAAQVLARPYQYHPWVYRAATVIMTNVGGLPHQLFEKQKPTQKLTDHKILTLFERPNAHMTERTFWEAMLANLLLSSGKAGQKDGLGGECFVVPWNSKQDQPVNLVEGKELPDTLFPFNRSFFKPTMSAGKTGMEVDGWTFVLPMPAGKADIKIPFESTEIIRIYLYNPYNVLAGLAPYISAMLAVNQDTKADVYNTKLFDNLGIPAGILSADQNLSPDQAEGYQERWDENFSGPANMNRTAVLGAGLKYQAIGITQADMQWAEQKAQNKDMIIAAFGLNKIALGDYEKINFATIREGRKMLWEDTYLPFDDVIWDALNAQFIRYYDGGKYRGESDLSGVGALRADFTKAAMAAAALLNSAAHPAMELVARWFHMTLTEEDLKKWPSLSEPSLAVPVGGASASSTPPNDGKAATALAPPSPRPQLRAPEKLTEEERAALVSEYVERVLAPPEGKAKKALVRFFVAQRNAMQDLVDKWLATQKAASVDQLPRSMLDGLSRSEFVDPAVFLLDVDDETDQLLKVLRPSGEDQLRLELDALEAELDGLTSWNLTPEKINSILSGRRKFLKGVNTTTMEKASDVISDTVAQGIEENWTPQELAKHLKQDVFDVSQIRINNATTIARTEMGSIASEERFEAFRAEGIEKWEWITSRDEKVRISHMGLDGDMVNVGERFENGLRFPRDPGAGDAGEVVGCRCVVVSVAPEE